MDSKQLPSPMMLDVFKRAIKTKINKGETIPEVVLLSKSKNRLIDQVYLDIHNSKDMFYHLHKTILRLKDLLEENKCFALPYRFYFYAKDRLWISPETDFHGIIKMPKMAYCSKEIGEFIFNNFFEYFKIYDPSETELVYVVGKCLDSIFISKELLIMPNYIKPEEWISSSKGERRRFKEMLEREKVILNMNKDR